MRIVHTNLSGSNGGAAIAAALGAGLPDGTGGGHHPAAVRAGGASAPNPAAGGGGIRHQPQLCIAHRGAGAGEAGKGAAKGVGG